MRSCRISQSSASTSNMWANLLLYAACGFSVHASGLVGSCVRVPRGGCAPAAVELVGSHCAVHAPQRRSTHLVPEGISADSVMRG